MTQLDFSLLTVPVAIIGGIATALYMPQRVTYDLDLLVHADDSAALGETLMQQGFRYDSALSIGGESWLARDGGVLDVIAWSEPWVRAALSEPARSPEGQPVIGLPWLVLMKLKAARLRDTDDVARMVALATEDDLARIRATVARWQPEDLDDFASLVTLGKLEMGE